MVRHIGVVILLMSMATDSFGQGGFIAEKGKPDQWATIKVFLSGVKDFTSKDREGWRNNGTSFTAKAAGKGAVTIKIDITGRAGVSSFDYVAGVAVVADKDAKLLSESRIISKDGGTVSFSTSWTPKQGSGVGINVKITGGNPERFTYYVSGTVGNADVPPVPVAPPAAQTPQASPAPSPQIIDRDPFASRGGRKSAARFHAINGQVEVFHAGRWTIAKLETIIDVGDHIRTDEGATCILGFADMSTYVMKPESEIVVVTPPGHDSKLALVAGNIWANIKSMAKYGSMEMDLNQAALAVKGTTFAASTTRESSAVSVIEGEVAFRSKASGKTINVKAGESVTATKSGLSSKARFDVPALTAEWNRVRMRTISGSPITAEEIFSNNNPYGVSNGGTSPVFEVKTPVLVSQIITYHWNGGRGAPAGTVGLRRSDGVVFGPWKATLRDSVYWEVNERIDLPPGSYSVIDSHPATWAQNAQSGGRGIVVVKGIRRESTGPATDGLKTSVTGQQDKLGARWDEVEGGWKGVWTRRGNSPVFDAVWTRDSLRITAVLTMEITGNRILVGRRQSTDGVDLDYTGTLSADGTSVAGEYHYKGMQQRWSATIRARD